jgi:hypothetical protein
VLEALVRATPKVNITLFKPTPMSPRPAIGRTCFRFSLTPDPRKSKNAITTRPAHVNLSATKGSGGISPTAYFTAAMLVPRAVAAEKSETSESSADLLSPFTKAILRSYHHRHTVPLA